MPGTVEKDDPAERGERFDLALPHSSIEENAM
jgi:hypothetical protein